MTANSQLPALEDLLVHSDWVHSLARSLVADSTAVDDVVQDTWVAALEHPPAREENLRGWLAKVARNVVRLRSRAEARRAEREARVAAERGDCLPSGADLAERLETQRRLAACVLDLSEPHRTTVLLRYYEGLSSAEIARRASVPAGTMRWRLSRAIAELRDRLDDEFGDKRSAWMGLLLPLARREHAATGASGASLVSEILSMGIGWKVMVGTLAVVLVLALTPFGALLIDAVLDNAALEPPVEVSSTTVDPPSPDPPDFGAGAEEQRAPAAAARSTADVAATGFRARLVDPDDAPIEGAEVFHPGFEGNRVVSGPDGRVEMFASYDELMDRYQGFGGFAFIKVDHPDYRSPSVEVRPEPGRVVDLGDIVLRPSLTRPVGSIEGRILDADGGAVPGSWVALSRRLGSLGGATADRETVLHYTAFGNSNAQISDAEGRFLLRAREGTVYVWAGAKGHEAALSGAIDVRRDEVTSGVDVILGRPNPKDYVTGVVLDPDGDPVPEAGIKGRHATGVTTTYCDGSGRFVLPSEDGLFTSLQAADSENRFAPARVEGVRGGDDLVLRLGRRERLRLEVHGKGELRELYAAVYDADREEMLVPWMEVERQGALLHVPIPAEPFVVAVVAEGHDLAVIGPFNGLAASRELSVDLVALPGVRGHVAAGGSPVVGAIVELFERRSWSLEHDGFLVRVEPEPSVQGETSAEGVFNLTLRQEGEYYLRVEASGYAPAEVGPFVIDPPKGRSGIEVSLSPGGTLEGRLIVPGGGPPTGRIVAVSRGDARPRSQRVKPDSSFRFEHLTPGPWHVRQVEEEVPLLLSRTTQPGTPFVEADIPVDCVVREGEVTRYDLAGGESVVLEGHVLLDGAPAAGLRIELSNTVGFIKTVEEEIGTNGDYRLVAGGPGSYRVRVSSGSQQGPEISEVIELARGTRPWSVEYVTGIVRVENAPPGDGTPGSTLDALVAEDGARLVFVPILPGSDGVAVLEGVPALPARIVRFRPDELVWGYESRRGGTMLVELAVVAGKETVVRLP